MTALAVSDVSVLRQLLEANEPVPVSGIGSVLTQFEASVLLGTTTHNINALIQTSLLPSWPTAMDLDDFRSTFMMMTDIQAKLQVRGISANRKMILSSARSAGVEPVVRLKYGHKTVWSRTDILRFLDDYRPEQSDRFCLRRH